MSLVVELLTLIVAIVGAELLLILYVIPKLGKAKPIAPQWPAEPLKVDVIGEGRGYFHAGPGNVSIEAMTVSHASFIGPPASIERVTEEPEDRMYATRPGIGCVVHYTTDDEGVWPAIVLRVHQWGVADPAVDLYLITSDGAGAIFDVPCGMGCREWILPGFVP